VAGDPHDRARARGALVGGGRGRHAVAGERGRRGRGERTRECLRFPRYCLAVPNAPTPGHAIARGRGLSSRPDSLAPRDDRPCSVALRSVLSRALAHRTTARYHLPSPRGCLPMKYLPLKDPLVPSPSPMERGNGPAPLSISNGEGRGVRSLPRQPGRSSQRRRSFRRLSARYSESGENTSSVIVPS